MADAFLPLEPAAHGEYLRDPKAAVAQLVVVATMTLLMISARARAAMKLPVAVPTPTATPPAFQVT